MKNLIILFMCFYFTTSANAQYVVDWSKAPLNFVPVRYTLNHFNIKGKVLEKTGPVDYLYFNKDGNLTESKEYVLSNFKYDKAGNLEQSVIANTTYKTNYICDEKGRIVQAKYSNGIITKYNYDEKGLYTGKEDLNSGVVYNNYSYDKEGRVIKFEEYVNGDLRSTTTYSYKQSGKNLEVVIKEKMVGQQESEDTNIYNERGDCISSSGNPIKYTYDKHNNILSVSYGDSPSVFKYVYQ